LYPHLDKERPIARRAKRAMDIAGSAMALLAGAPVFAAVAVAVRLSSPGPILFRQERVGRYGKKFKMLKFRSMYVNNDASEHKAFVKQMIAGAKAPPAGGTGEVFKITNDKRITPVGRFLRKTSLDEIPQFLNVLLGQMSLVGPRPPLGYEVESYDLWHRRRLLAVKPGITGPWQVAARSRVPFDEMVRLDLRYAQTWSPWEDLKLLAATPRAVIAGAH
jgi:lipopolysaccharide/colanic/teichoic acid biosynthesis glycosyltransferase